ncbi:MAG: ABC-F family ATP-binding cassette domain-containing protein [Bacilli bacterium]|nr:ABC-F family ATP-binding cassette domain-containing protein [Bacilli bacterium]
MNIDNLTFAYDNDYIFKEVTITINKKDIVGITGVNGAGKTTLFKLILKELKPDKGNIVLPKNTRISYLPQLIKDNLTNDDITVFDYLLKARPIEELEKKLNELYNLLPSLNEKEQNKKLKQIGKIQNDLEYWDWYNAENILLKIIDNMNIENLLEKKITELSGGQKSKIAFARLIYSKPEIILLDEPTNHMDKETKDYITKFIKNYQGTILIISHDEKFLNEVTNKTLFIDKNAKKMTIYKGNYEHFKKIMSSLEEQLLNQIKIQQKEEERLTKIVLKYTNSSGNRKKMAQSREKNLEKLKKNKIQIPPKQKQVKLNLDPIVESSNIPLKIKNLTFGYDKLLINNLTLDIYKKEKFLILGKNGVGKTTLLKLINNILKPNSGEIIKTNKTTIAYYAQEHELLNEEETIINNMKSIDIKEQELKNILGRFLFHGNELYKKIKVLSPGERSRVALAKMMLKRANVLLLDEPTNHLDIDTKNIIATALNEYKGTILLVSHDTDFVKKIDITRTLLLPEGKIDYFDIKTVEYYDNLNKK